VSQQCPNGVSRLGLRLDQNFADADFGGWTSDGIDSQNLTGVSLNDERRNLLPK
jgi:hypothetical protein